MLAGLRHDPFVGGDDEQGEVDAAGAGEHVVDEALVAGDVDEADDGAVRRRHEAKPRSMVMPRAFSSGRRSASMPVSARTRVVLPWSMWPAVPTIMAAARPLPGGRGRPPPAAGGLDGAQEGIGQLAAAGLGAQEPDEAGVGVARHALAHVQGGAEHRLGVGVAETRGLAPPAGGGGGVAGDAEGVVVDHPSRVMAAALRWGGGGLGEAAGLGGVGRGDLALEEQPAQHVLGLGVASLRCLAVEGALGLRLREPRSEERNDHQVAHCRAEVYLADTGWTPVDPADVRKVVLEDPPGGSPRQRRDDGGAREALRRLGRNWMPSMPRTTWSCPAPRTRSPS